MILFGSVRAVTLGNHALLEREMKNMFATAAALIATAGFALAVPVTVDLGHMNDPAAGCDRIEVRSELPNTKGDLLYVTYKGGCAPLLAAETRTGGGMLAGEKSADAGSDNGDGEAGGDV